MFALGCVPDAVRVEMNASCHQGYSMPSIGFADHRITVAAYVDLGCSQATQVSKDPMIWLQFFLIAPFLMVTSPMWTGAVARSHRSTNNPKNPMISHCRLTATQCLLWF